MFKFNFLSVVVSEISGGPKFTSGDPAFRGCHLAEKFSYRSKYFTTYVIVLLISTSSSNNFRDNMVGVPSLH